MPAKPSGARSESSASPKPKRSGGTAPRPSVSPKRSKKPSRPGARPKASPAKKAEDDLRARAATAQQTLERISTRWRATFDAMDEAICLLDQDQAIVACNQAMTGLLGKPYEKIIGRPCWELVHGTRASIDRCPTTRMWKSRRRECLLLPVGDRQLDVEVHPVLDENGVPTAAVHVITDVTERKLAEKQVRDRLDRLNALYAATRKLSGSLDLQRLAENVVGTCVQNFGVSLAWLGRAEPDSSVSIMAHFPMRGRSLTRARLRWDESPGGRGPVGRAIDSGLPVVVHDVAEEPRLARDLAAAQERGIRTGAAFPLAVAGTTFGVLVLFSDEPEFFSPERMEFLHTYVNEAATLLQNAELVGALQEELAGRKRTEDTLLNRMNDLAILHEASQTFIGLDDEQKTLDSLCTIAVRGLGLRMAWVGLVRQDDFDVHPVASHGFEDDYLSCIRVTWDDSPTGRGPTGTAIRTGKPVPMDDIETDPSYEPWRAQAMARGYRSSASMPLVYQNKVFGTLNSYSTEPEHFTQERLQLLQSLANAAAVALQRTRLYAQVKRSADVLQETVKERTAELAETNTELETFAYSVSHDLRAPLRALQGISAALRADYADRLDETGRDYTRRIEEAAERMDLLIQDLLAYSRLTRAEIRLKPVALSAVVAESLAGLESEAREQHAEIQAKEPLPEVIGHRATLVQAVSNLVANAMMFVATGVKPHVRISSETRDGRVRLWIADNGIGVAPEHHERIFHVFERLHGIETYPGTGIGLAIVRKSMDRMDGNCGVESTLGEGSRFWIELPADEGEHRLAGDQDD